MEKAAYRGLMLDVSRHYMPPEDIRRLVDAAALCGLNRLHWHLTDDQGWRIEIRKYPRLTGVGSVRGASAFGAVSGTEHNCGHYTREEVRELDAYARERGVELVPEIEIPGHASAMLAAYPEYGCARTVAAGEGETRLDAPYVYRVQTTGGIFPNLICAGKPEAVRFLKDILDEVAELFPGPFVHIGGDEAIKLHWRRCPDCRRRMREQGLRNEEELQRALVLEMGAYLSEKGKRVIVYNDALAGGPLPEYFTVQHWLGNDRETAAFLKAGGGVIRSDVSHFYFDYPYSSVDVRKLWAMPAVPPWAEDPGHRLLGFECMLWTERVTNVERAGYLLFPRLPAAALRMGNPAGYAGWEDFTAALREIQDRIGRLGLTGAPERDWFLSPEDAEADRLAEEARQRTPETALSLTVERRLLLQERLELLLGEIGMPFPFALRVADCALAALPGWNGGVSGDGSDGAAELADQLIAALQSREAGPWSALPEKVWVDTMKCFSRFVGEHYRSWGRYGFDRGFWTTRQVGARLFRLGALEYELTEEDGGPVLSLHIPSDIRLVREELNASAAMAGSFLAAYFPRWANAPILCDSWLLSPALEGLLPQESNILGFQRAFSVTEWDRDADDALEWVFRLAAGQRDGVSLRDLPQDTSLQRRMKAFLLEGGKVGSARGVFRGSF